MGAMTKAILHSACSGMFSDELDRMGYRAQVVDGLTLNRANGRIYGQARTVRLETFETPDENIRMGLGFLGELEEGDVLCVEGSSAFAYFGELMTRLSVRQKLGGVVIGGLTRDSNYTQDETRLCVFAEAYSPRDIKGRGRVAATDVPIRLRNVPVSPGDHIFGDRDGVVVIPKGVAAEVESRIVTAIGGEAKIIDDIAQGVTVTEILNRYREF